MNVTVVTAGGQSAAVQFIYVAAPTVTSVSPATGPAGGGTTVTITGTGLTNATAVYFGKTLAAIVTDPAGGPITVISPAGVAGTVDVTVVTAGGTSATSVADDFTYVAAPVVTGISPSVGPAGTTVTITGTGLTNATVKFGTVTVLAANVISDSPTQIVVVSPANIVGTVDVTVVTAVGTSATSAADQFTYVQKPIVSGVSPGKGPAVGGSTVTIAGTGLANATAVWFVDKTLGAKASATIVPGSNTSTQLVVTSPAGVANDTDDVEVVTAGGQSASATADQFIYVAAPTVTSVSPATGPAGGGTTVTITGTGLANATAVYFGKTAAAIVTDPAGGPITAISPAGVAGTVDVTVVTAGGTSVTSLADLFTYVAAPVVTGISPSVGPAGTTVTITGTGLTNATVKFGTVTVLAANVISDSPTQIVVVSAANIVGTVDVTVVTAVGTSATSAADQFTYVQKPIVSGVSPGKGPAVGGSTVTIAGTGLANATAVWFVDKTSGAKASATIVPGSNTSTQLVVTSPAGVAGDTDDVEVVTVGGQSASATADQFIYVAAPTVAGLDKHTGPAGGGTTVTITGTNLTSAMDVYFGTTLATIVSNSGTQIVVNSPANIQTVGTNTVFAGGTVDITVLTVGGTSATSVADQFTYVAAPAVTSISPSAGSVGTKTTLMSAISNAATTITVADASQFPAASGTFPFIIQVDGEQMLVKSVVSGTGNKTWNVVRGYNNTTAVSHNQNAVVSGGLTTVTITGTNLANATAVYFGTVAATVISDAAGQIVVTSPPNVAGTVDVTVVTTGGTSATLAADQFTYAPAPVVTSLSPATGPAAGGTTVTITGTGLANATAVKFGSTLATIVSDNGTQIVVTTPTGVAGPAVDVTVVTAGGTSAISSADQFTYVAAPDGRGRQPGIQSVGRRHHGDDHRHEPGESLGRGVRQHAGHDYQRHGHPDRGHQPGIYADDRRRHDILRRHSGRDGGDGGRHVGHFVGRPIHLRGASGGPERESGDGVCGRRNDGDHCRLRPGQRHGRQVRQRHGEDHQQFAFSDRGDQSGEPGGECRQHGGRDRGDGGRDLVYLAGRSIRLLHGAGSDVP